MAAITICSDFGAPKIKSVTVSTDSPSICHEVMGPDAMILVFWMLSFKPTFSLSSFTFIKRLLSSSSLSAIRVVSSAYLRLLIISLTILLHLCFIQPSVSHDFWLGTANGEAHQEIKWGRRQRWVTSSPLLPCLAHQEHRTSRVPAWRLQHSWGLAALSHPPSPDAVPGIWTVPVPLAPKHLDTMSCSLNLVCTPVNGTLPWVTGGRLCFLQGTLLIKQVSFKPHKTSWVRTVPFCRWEH